MTGVQTCALPIYTYTVAVVSVYDGGRRLTIQQSPQGTTSTTAAAALNPPTRPDHANVSSVSGVITLSWSLATAAYPVEIWRAADGGASTKLAVTNGSQYIDTTAAPGVEYKYSLIINGTSTDIGTGSVKVADNSITQAGTAASDRTNIMGVTAAVQGVSVNLQWTPINDPAVAGYDIYSGPANGTIDTATLLAAVDVPVTSVSTPYNPYATKYYVRPRLSGGSLVLNAGTTIIAALGAPAVSIQVSEPNIIISWPTVSGAYIYRSIVNTGGVAYTDITAATSITLPIPPRTTTITVRAEVPQGIYSTWTTEELDITGIYAWNEIININIPSFNSGTLVNMAWINGNTVQRPSIRGGVVAAPYVADTNDSDLWNFVDKFGAPDVSQLTCDVAWYRDKWWRTDASWFESQVYDLGGSYTGRLIIGLESTVTDYTADVADMDGIDISLLDYINHDALVSSAVHLTADVEISLNQVNWKPVRPGDWVTMRYCRFRVSVLDASPLVDIRITTGEIALDVPDITESGTATIAGGVTTRAITLSKPFTNVNSVICNAAGTQQAWATGVSANGFTINLSSNPGTTSVYWFAKGY